jgi:hypothetical protein
VKAKPRSKPRCFKCGRVAERGLHRIWSDPPKARARFCAGCARGICRRDGVKRQTVFPFALAAEDRGLFRPGPGERPPKGEK